MEEQTNTNILELSCSEARSFLLKGKNYCNFDLPPYFEFDQLIEDISKTLRGKNLSDFYLNGKLPKSCENVNYKLLSNKDGKYAWRPFQFIHPALYVSLVHKITEVESWETIVDRFADFSKNQNIQCKSIPVRSDTKESGKAVMISHWWNEVEQASIELALDFQYLLETDIADCYGSIYTHAIAWALHGKQMAKNNRNGKQLIGNVIDCHLQDMSFGQTNGIPQGSVLMDFIAEMVLGYVDLEISNKIENSIEDYKIIRYRDDYRVFVNNPQDGELIVKTISEVLIDLGMKLSPHKTSSSDEVVKDSLKADKRYWLLHRRTDDSLQKHLLIIHSLSHKHPNSGSLVIALNDFLIRINKLEATHDNLVVLISILTDIAFKNPRTIPIFCAILSKLMYFLDEEKTNSIIRRIRKRFEKIPNTGHLELWLQRISYKLKNNDDYSENLCKIVSGEGAPIWNSDWLNEKLKKLVNPTKIINKETLDKITPVIELGEVELFKGYR